MDRFGLASHSGGESEEKRDVEELGEPSFSDALVSEDEVLEEEVRDGDEDVP